MYTRYAAAAPAGGRNRDEYAHLLQGEHHVATAILLTYSKKKQEGLITQMAALPFKKRKQESHWASASMAKPVRFQTGKPRGRAGA